MTALMSNASTTMEQQQKGTGAMVLDTSMPPLDSPNGAPQGFSDLRETSDYGQGRQNESIGLIAPQFSPFIEPIAVPDVKTQPFQAVQKWQGYVTEIDEAEGIFFAHLTTT